jgi:hypothetical protein
MAERPFYRILHGRQVALIAIMQTSDYFRLPLDCTGRARQDILEMVKENMPASWDTRRRPLDLLCSSDHEIQEAYDRRTLPAVLCIGRFIGDVPDTGPTGWKRHTRHFAWLQDDFLPHMSEANLHLMGLVDWASR